MSIQSHWDRIKSALTIVNDVHWNSKTLIKLSFYRSSQFETFKYLRINCLRCISNEKTKKDGYMIPIMNHYPRNG